MEALLDGANDETWPAIRKLLRREGELAVYGLTNALSGFDMDEETRNKMLSDLEKYGRGIVETKAKEEAGRALMRMKDRCHHFTLSSFPCRITSIFYSAF